MARKSPFPPVAAAILAALMVPGPAAAFDPDVQQLRSRMFSLEAEVRALQRQGPAPSAPTRVIADPAMLQRLQTLELQVVGLGREVAEMKKALAALEKDRP